MAPSCDTVKIERGELSVWVICRECEGINCVRVKFGGVLRETVAARCGGCGREIRVELAVEVEM